MPRGSVITGVFRWGDYSNSAGYYHTGISIGDGKIISLGSDGLILEDAAGTVGGCFPSAGYSEVDVGDYRSPAPIRRLPRGNRSVPQEGFSENAPTSQPGRAENSMSWAPCQSTSSPNSVRCSRPSTIVMKWFPARSPILLAKDELP